MKFDVNRFMVILGSVLGGMTLIVLFAMPVVIMIKMYSLFLPALIGLFDGLPMFFQIGAEVCGAAFLITGLLYLLAPRTWWASDETKSPEDKTNV